MSKSIKGVEPLKISPIVTSLLGTTDLTANTTMPNGGVNKPASTIKMPIMAKVKGSMPSTLAIGQKMGTVNNMIDIESMNIPSTIQIAIMKSTVTPTPHSADRIIA